MIELMIVLMHTDLPEPVAPAMSTCGIFAMSATTGAPEIPLPSATAVGDFSRIISGLSSTSRRETVSIFSFGISMPTAGLPGIGASMRTPSAAMFSAMSSTRFTMRETFTPGAGCSS